MTLFEKIIRKEVKAKIIYEDNHVMAFKDIRPARPGHFLVVPKKFSTNLIDIGSKDYQYLMDKARQLALETIKSMRVSGFNLIVNNGQPAGQEIMYTHVHIIPSLI
ncbi:histidine triad protein HinT [Mycoplasma sp. ATU-Cv-703]|uniref:histidine triad protein HinT n=1 Tax=Mycoplasma sp. ATU-Cv-703 TaxID=2498595 RepID=UPI000FDD15E1